MLINQNLTLNLDICDDLSDNYYNYIVFNAIRMILYRILAFYKYYQGVKQDFEKIMNENKKRNINK